MLESGACTFASLSLAGVLTAIFNSVNLCALLSRPFNPRQEKARRKAEKEAVKGGKKPFYLKKGLLARVASPFLFSRHQRPLPVPNRRHSRHASRKASGRASDSNPRACSNACSNVCSTVRSFDRAGDRKKEELVAKFNELKEKGKLQARTSSSNHRSIIEPSFGRCGYSSTHILSNMRVV